jgi:hypothetical protein
MNWTELDWAQEGSFSVGFDDIGGLWLIPFLLFCFFCLFIPSFCHELLTCLATHSLVWGTDGYMLLGLSCSVYGSFCILLLALSVFFLLRHYVHVTYQQKPPEQGMLC